MHATDYECDVPTCLHAANLERVTHSRGLMLGRKAEKGFKQVILGAAR